MKEWKNSMGGFFMLDFASEAMVSTPAKKLNRHYISIKIVSFTNPGFVCKDTQLKFLIMLFISNRIQVIGLRE